MSLLVHTLTYLHRFSEEVQSTRLYYLQFFERPIFWKWCSKIAKKPNLTKQIHQISVSHTFLLKHKAVWYRYSYDIDVICRYQFFSKWTIFCLKCKIFRKKQISTSCIFKQYRLASLYIFHVWSSFSKEEIRFISFLVHRNFIKKTWCSYFLDFLDQNFSIKLPYTSTMSLSTPTVNKYFR